MTGRSVAGSWVQLIDRRHRPDPGWQRSLLTNAGYLLATEMTISAAGLAFWGLAARLLAAELVGLVAGILAAVALTSAVAGLGTGVGLVRLLPAAADRARLLNTTVTCNLLLGLFSAAVYLLLLPLWSRSLLFLRTDPRWAAAFLAYAALAPVASLMRSAFVALRQAGRQLVAAALAAGGRLLLLPLALTGGAGGLLAAATVPTAAAVLLSLFGLAPRSIPGYRPRPRLAARELRTLLPYSAAVYAADLPLQVMQRALPLLILERLGPAAGGYAQIAWLIGTALAAPGLALVGAAFAEGAHDRGRERPILLTAAAVGLLVTLPPGAAVVLGGRWLLALAGPAYAEHGLGLLRWLAAGSPVVVLAWCIFTHLRLRCRLRRLLLLSALPPVATLTLAAPLLPHLGLAVVGAAWVAGHAAVVVLSLGALLPAAFPRRRSACGEGCRR
jgi:O-antigen/teichoic acid export membrane protein